MLSHNPNALPREINDLVVGDVPALRHTDTPG